MRGIQKTTLQEEVLNLSTFKVCQKPSFFDSVNVLIFNGYTLENRGGQKERFLTIFNKHSSE